MRILFTSVMYLGLAQAADKHPYQSELPFPIDAFESVNNGIVLTKAELENMYYEEHKSMAVELEEKKGASKSLHEKGEIVSWA